MCMIKNYTPISDSKSTLEFRTYQSTNINSAGSHQYAKALVSIKITISKSRSDNISISAPNYYFSSNHSHSSISDNETNQISWIIHDARRVLRSRCQFNYLHHERIRSIADYLSLCTCCCWCHWIQRLCVCVLLVCECTRWIAGWFWMLRNGALFRHYP